jgi:FkbM family methyltransferase
MNRLTQSAYTSLLRLLSAGRGLAWRVDDVTTLRIDPRCRWIRNSSYEADVAAYLRAGIRPGQCCVDVGAHVGFYALQMALWTAPDGRVIAFEPNPTARAVLQANVSLNRVSERVTIEPSAAGAARGTADLFHSGDTSGLSRLDAPNPDSSSAAPVRVPVVTLDEYCATHRIRPDWMLVDAEGADLAVLQGAAALLRDTPVQVVVEMHASLWDPRHTTPAGFEGFLHSCGRIAVPITGQQNPFVDYGTVALRRVDGGAYRS